MNCLLWKGSERASVCFFLQAVCDEGIARLFGGKWMQRVRSVLNVVRANFETEIYIYVCSIFLAFCCCKIA